MRRFALALLLFPALAVPSMAQVYQGNWSCRDASTNRVGILTIYGNVYGWASRTMGDPNSGTGTLTPYQDGVTLNDGNLVTSAGIKAARTIEDPVNGLSVQLETDSAIVMLCTPR